MIKKCVLSTIIVQHFFLNYDIMKILKTILNIGFRFEYWYLFNRLSEKNVDIISVKNNFII